MAYTRSNIFTMTNLNNDYKLKLVCGAFTYSQGAEYELPKDAVISDIIVKKQFANNLPQGRQIADSLDFSIDANALRLSGHADVLAWIQNYGRDNPIHYNGTTDNEFYDLTTNAEYLPNLWILERNGIVEYIGTQIANPTTKITFEEQIIKIEIKTTSVQKWLMEKIFAQFWNIEFFNKWDMGWSNFFGFSNPIIFAFSGAQYRTLVNVYKNYNGKRRIIANQYHSGSDKPDWYHSAMYIIKLTDLLKLMSEIYRYLAMQVLRMSLGGSLPIYNGFSLPNPLLNYNYYENPKNSHIQGDLLDYDDLLINIGYNPAEAGQKTFPLDTQFHNLWDFAEWFYSSNGMQLVFDYTNCGFKTRPITDNISSKEILIKDLTAVSSIEDISDLYTEVQVRTKNVGTLDKSIFNNTIGFSDSGTKIATENIVNNNVNHCSIGQAFDGNLKICYNRYDTKQLQNFPLYKIFYDSADMLADSGGEFRFLKVSDLQGYITNGAEIVPSSYNVNYIDWNTLDEANAVVSVTELNSNAQNIADIMKKYYMNKNLFLLECELDISLIDSSDLGKNFTLEFNNIFSSKTGLTANSNKAVLINVDLDYSNNNAKCIFLIRSDIYANN